MGNIFNKFKSAYTKYIDSDTLWVLNDLYSRVFKPIVDVVTPSSALEAAEFYTPVYSDIKFGKDIAAEGEADINNGNYLSGVSKVAISPLVTTATLLIPDGVDAPLKAVAKRGRKPLTEAEKLARQNERHLAQVNDNAITTITVDNSANGKFGRGRPGKNDPRTHVKDLQSKGNVFSMSGPPSKDPLVVEAWKQWKARKQAAIQAEVNKGSYQNMMTSQFEKDKTASKALNKAADPKLELRGAPKGPRSRKPLENLNDEANAIFTSFSPTENHQQDIKLIQLNLRKAGFNVDFESVKRAYIEYFGKGESSILETGGQLNYLAYIN